MSTGNWVYSHHIFSQLKCWFLENCPIMDYYEHSLLLCNASKLWRLLLKNQALKLDSVLPHLSMSWLQQFQRQAYHLQNIARLGILTGEIWWNMRITCSNMKTPTLWHNKHNHHNIPKTNWRTQNTYEVWGASKAGMP